MVRPWGRPSFIFSVETKQLFFFIFLSMLHFVVTEQWVGAGGKQTSCDGSFHKVPQHEYVSCNSPWRAHTAPPARQYWRQSLSQLSSPETYVCSHEFKIDNNVRKDRLLKRSLYICVPVHLNKLTSVSRQGQWILTTLRFVVSSMVWMTRSLCLKRICSITSARIEPNFWHRKGETERLSEDWN